jgi:hypothetical protein
MVVVTGAAFVPRRRAGGLDPADQPSLGQDAEGVVDGLLRDRADPAADRLGDLVGRGVWAFADGTQDGEALSRDLEPGSAKEDGGIVLHSVSIGLILD